MPRICLSSAKLLLGAACLALLAGCMDKSPDTELDWGVYNHGWPDAGQVDPPEATQTDTPYSQSADASTERNAQQMAPAAGYHAPERDSVEVSSLDTVPNKNNGLPTEEEYANAPIHREKSAVHAPRALTSPRTTTSAEQGTMVQKTARTEKPVARVAGAPAFLWPLHGKILYGFGDDREGGQNDGINIAARKGAPIHAAASGTVEYAGHGIAGYGNLVLIRHKGNYFTAYAHAEKLKVHKGDPVIAGEVIGYAGMTGDVSSPQLHFEIRHGKKPVNPSRYLGKGARG